MYIILLLFDYKVSFNLHANHVTVLFKNKHLFIIDKSVTIAVSERAQNDSGDSAAEFMGLEFVNYY